MTLEQKRAKEAAKKRAQRERRKSATVSAEPTIDYAPEGLIDSIPTIGEPTVESRLLELHPAALQVCLGRYFAMAYKELPPFLPRTMTYDGCYFHASDDRRNGEIILTIKRDAYNRQNSDAEVMRFPLAAFKNVFIQI